MNAPQRKDQLDIIPKWEEPKRPLIDEIEKEKRSEPDWSISPEDFPAPTPRPRS